MLAPMSVWCSFVRRGRKSGPSPRRPFCRVVRQGCHPTSSPERSPLTLLLGSYRFSRGGGAGDGTFVLRVRGEAERCPGGTEVCYLSLKYRLRVLNSTSSLLRPHSAYLPLLRCGIVLVVLPTCPDYSLVSRCPFSFFRRAPRSGAGSDPRRLGTGPPLGVSVKGSILLH